ncbi:MAG TPA: hypothetical protein VF540_13350, partial [Segetibacter sp.]
SGFQEINHLISEHLQTKTAFPVRPDFNEEVIIIFALGVLQPEELRSNELIGVQPTEVNKLYNINVSAHSNKYVIRQPVTFKDKTMHNVHRLLRAIDKNIILSKQDEKDIAKPHGKVVSQASLVKDFAQYPSILTNTLKLLDGCSINIELHTDKTKKVYSAQKNDDRVLLEKLAMDGMKQAIELNLVECNLSIILTAKDIFFISLLHLRLLNSL